MTEDAAAVVFGYHEVGTVCLELLLERGVRVAALFTHEHDPLEERWFRTPASVAEAAGIPVYRPGNPNTEEWRARVRALKGDVLFSFYYRRMLSPELLAYFPLGAYNMHGSLLPKYRGRAPVNWAVIGGESRTGATLHVMTRRADAGDIVDQEPVVIGASDTARHVFTAVTQAARVVLGRSVAAILRGQPPRTPQDEREATYFGGRCPEDGRIDWRWPAQRIFNLIRGVTHPYPGAFSDGDGGRLYLWWGEPCAGHGAPGEILSVWPLVVAAGEGALRVHRAQWAGSMEVDGDAVPGLRPGMVLH